MESRSVVRPSNGVYHASHPSTLLEPSSTQWRSLTPSTQSSRFRSTVAPGPATDAGCGGPLSRTSHEGRWIGTGYDSDGKNRGLARVREPGTFSRADHGRRRADHG